MIKNFFLATAALELLTALALLFTPSLTTSLLFGVPLETTVAITVARMTGAALFTITIACWYARNDVQSRAAIGLLVAMLFYNVAVLLLFGYSALAYSLAGIVFFPAIVAHVLLSALGIVSLRRIFNSSSSK